jgi:phosphate starvation-inducible PhoH-like protein
MPKQKGTMTIVETNRIASSRTPNKFHVEYLNVAQKMAYACFQQHDVVFLVGPGGVGKTHLAMAFAINEVLLKNKKKVVLTRPIIEAGESLGFLPGELENKVHPYMLPLEDCLARLVGDAGPQREVIERSIELCPLAYMRGRTFYNSICILDEAQNATEKQLKMFLTRFGDGTKLIITGDPRQSDLNEETVPLINVVNKLETVPGIGIIRFKEDSIVRHPLVAAIINKLEE